MPRRGQLDASALLRESFLDREGVVVPVAPFGRPVAQAPWQSFEAATGIPVVIDGAASFDVVDESRDPAIGDVPVALSFHATKAFATGEGGGGPGGHDAGGRRGHLCVVNLLAERYSTLGFLMVERPDMTHILPDVHLGSLPRRNTSAKKFRQIAPTLAIKAMLPELCPEARLALERYLDLYRLSR